MIRQGSVWLDKSGNEVLIACLPTLYDDSGSVAIDTVVYTYGNGYKVISQKDFLKKGFTYAHQKKHSDKNKQRS